MNAKITRFGTIEVQTVTAYRHCHPHWRGHDDNVSQEYAAEERGAGRYLCAMRSSSCCSEQVIQPKLESSIGYDFHEGYIQAGVQAPDTLSADHTPGCIQHTIVDLYATITADHYLSALLASVIVERPTV